jgi:hypothetical protein
MKKCRRAGSGHEPGGMQPPQGSPTALALGEERMRSEVDRRFPLAQQVLPLWRLQRSCWPTACKAPRGVREKRFQGGFLAAPAEMVKKPAGEARLVATGLPRWMAAGVAVAPRQRKSRSIQRFFYSKCLKLSQQKFHLLAKIRLAKQTEHQKLAQPGKGQCLPSAVHGGQGVPKESPRPKWLQWCMHIAHP